MSELEGGGSQLSMAELEGGGELPSISELEGEVAIYLKSGLLRGVVPPSMSGLVVLSSLSRPDGAGAIFAMSGLETGGGGVPSFYVWAGGRGYPIVYV